MNSVPKSTCFLLGMLIGTSLAAGIGRKALHRARELSRIEAVIVPESVYQRTKQVSFVIKNVPSAYSSKPRDLKITILHPDAIVKVYAQRFPWDKNSEVFGFYDILRNEIYSPNDVATLIHELRHVFEGDYHQ